MQYGAHSQTKDACLSGLVSFYNLSPHPSESEFTDTNIFMVPFSDDTKEKCMRFSEYNLALNYATDPCLKSAVHRYILFSFNHAYSQKMSPEHLKLESSPICPNTPLDGEPTARVYVVR